MYKDYHVRPSPTLSDLSFWVGSLGGICTACVSDFSLSSVIKALHTLLASQSPSARLEIQTEIGPHPQVLKSYSIIVLKSAIYTVYYYPIITIWCSLFGSASALKSWSLTTENSDETDSDDNHGQHAV